MDTKNVEPIDVPKEALAKIKPPQKMHKYLALKILEDFGGKLIGFERLISGGRVDILAKLDGKTIAIECGPCRVNKAIDYLRNDNTELWLISNWLDAAQFIRIQRGPNWDKELQKHDATLKSELMKIKPLLD